MVSWGLECVQGGGAKVITNHYSVFSVPPTGGEPLYNLASLMADQGGGSRECSSVSPLAQRLRTD